MNIVLANQAESKPIIRFAAGLYDKMIGSVGRFPPEHYALLSGYLNDPLYVRDLMPLPPMTDAAGHAKSNSASVTLNGPFIEYYLNTVLIPAGMYPLGAIHSHPGDMNILSGGVEGSGQGDIPSMRSHLEAARKFEKPWHNYLAPIVTHPGDNPKITGYIVRLDCAEPIPADIVWHVPAKTKNVELEDRSPLASTFVTPKEIIDRAMPWQNALAQVAQDENMLECDRDFLENQLRQYRETDMDALRNEIQVRLRASKSRRSFMKLGLRS